MGPTTSTSLSSGTNKQNITKQANDLNTFSDAELEKIIGMYVELETLPLYDNPDDRTREGAPRGAQHGGQQSSSFLMD